MLLGYSHNKFATTNSKNRHINLKLKGHKSTCAALRVKTQNKQITSFNYKGSGFISWPKDKYFIAVDDFTFPLFN